MKKLFLYLCLCLIFPFSNFAQADQSTDENELYIGLTIGAFGFTNFKGSQPFQVAYPLYVGPTWLKGNWALNPFYNVGNHSVGAFLAYTFNDDLGAYLVIDDSIGSNFGIYGVGITTPLVNPYVQGFVEIGGNYGDEPDPSLLFGVWITFGKKVASW